MTGVLEYAMRGRELTCDVHIRERDQLPNGRRIHTVEVGSYAEFLTFEEAVAYATHVRMVAQGRPPSAEYEEFVRKVVAEHEARVKATYSRREGELLKLIRELST